MCERERECECVNKTKWCERTDGRGQRVKTRSLSGGKKRREKESRVIRWRRKIQKQRWMSEIES